MQPLIVYDGNVSDSSAAPGRLEQVRTFLNTWRIPNDTRTAVDQLTERTTALASWAKTMPDIPPSGRRELGNVRAVRDELRCALGQTNPTSLADLVDAQRWHIELTSFPTRPALRMVPARPTTIGSVLAIVLDAVAAGTWHRLRACPDCGWVFYDSSRNARRTWCSMTAGGGARGCGSIAKTRAYRTRHR